jgi:hypothetical protein
LQRQSRVPFDIDQLLLFGLNRRQTGSKAAGALPFDARRAEAFGAGAAVSRPESSRSKLVIHSPRQVCSATRPMTTGIGYRHRGRRAADIHGGRRARLVGSQRAMNAARLYERAGWNSAKTAEES